jgi:hypothetical protein
MCCDVAQSYHVHRNRGSIGGWSSTRIESKERSVLRARRDLGEPPSASRSDRRSPQASPPRDERATSCARRREPPGQSQGKDLERRRSAELPPRVTRPVRPIFSYSPPKRCCATASSTVANRLPPSRRHAGSQTQNARSARAEPAASSVGPKYEEGREGRPISRPLSDASACRSSSIQRSRRMLFPQGLSLGRTIQFGVTPCSTGAPGLALAPCSLWRLYALSRRPASRPAASNASTIPNRPL